MVNLCAKSFCKVHASIFAFSSLFCFFAVAEVDELCVTRLVHGNGKDSAIRILTRSQAILK